MKTIKSKLQYIWQLSLLLLLTATINENTANAQLIETVLHVNQSNETPQISYNFNPTQWYYVAFTKPISGPGKMYINGTHIGDIDWKVRSFDHHIMNFGSTFYITYRDFFDGTLDEVRISSKERTDTEISDYFTSNSSFTSDVYTLQLWRFDEGSGEDFFNAANDLIGDVIGEPAWVDGKFGQAIKYDGVDDRLRVNYDMPEYGVTYEFWVKFDGTVKDTKQTILQPYGAFSIDFTIQQNADAPIVDPATPEFTLGTASTAQNSTISIPVTVRDFIDVLTMQGTITWDPALLTFQGAQDFAIKDLDEDAFYLFEPGKLTYSWSPSDLQAVSVDDDTEIYSLYFEAIGAPGSEADVVFSDDPTPREVADAGSQILKTTYIDGKISILSNQVACGGYIKTQSGEALENVEVFLSGSEENKTTTDEYGWYSFDLVPGQAYNIQPQLNLETDDGITTLDIVIMHWHILGQKYMMSDFDLIASDVNESKSLTTLDLAETRAIILHTEEQFRQRNAIEFINHQYKGTPDPFAYESSLDIIPDGSYSNLDFTAVKLGDAGRSWNANISNGRIKDIDELEIILEPHVLANGKISMPIRTMDSKQIVGLQFTLEWDPLVLNFQALFENLIAFNANLELVEEGMLTVTWNSDQIEGITIDEESVLSSIEFELLNPEQDLTVNITSGLTPAYAYNSNLEALNIKSKFHEDLTPSELNIFPNPAGEYIQFSFGMQNPVAYSILSTTGKIVSRGNLNDSNKINISNLRNGIYFLQVADYENQKINKKFIKR